MWAVIGRADSPSYKPLFSKSLLFIMPKELNLQVKHFESEAAGALVLLSSSPAFYVKSKCNAYVVPERLHYVIGVSFTLLH